MIYSRRRVVNDRGTVYYYHYKQKDEDSPKIRISEEAYRRKNAHTGNKKNRRKSNKKSNKRKSNRRKSNRRKKVNTQKNLFYGSQDFGEIIKKIDVTPEQKQALEKIRPKIEALRNKMVKVQLQLLTNRNEETLRKYKKFMSEGLKLVEDLVNIFDISQLKKSGITEEGLANICLASKKIQEEFGVNPMKKFC